MLEDKISEKGKGLGVDLRQRARGGFMSLGTGRAGLGVPRGKRARAGPWAKGSDMKLFASKKE